MTLRRAALAGIGALALLAASVGAGLVAGLWAVWWAYQEAFLYPVPTDRVRTEDLAAAAAASGAEPFALVAEDGARLLGWRRRGDGRRLVLFFSGNGEALSDYVAFHDLAVAEGFDLATVAYRGFPGSDPAVPTEAGLARDARALWGWALAEGYEPARIVVHGRSLGGGVAAELVRGETPDRAIRPAGLVLESTFVRLPAVVDQWTGPLLPHRLLTRNVYDTLGHADALGLPTLVLHCTGDALIPPDLGGRALAAALPDARYVEVPGLSHADDLPVTAPEAGRAWADFLRAVTR